MNNFETEVKNNLLMLKGKSASEITHGLKTLDGGEGISLIDNIIKVWEKINENHQMEISKIRKNTGTICFAMLGTVIVGSVYVGIQLRKLKKNEEVYNALIKDLKNAVNEKTRGEKNIAIVQESDNSYTSTGHDCVIAEYATTNN